MTTSVIGTDTAGFEQAWQRWHTEREAYYSAPLGWVALTGLFWLTDDDQQIDDLPGRWRATDDALFVTADAADGLTVDGAVLTGVTELNPVEGAPGLIIASGDRTIEAIRRTGSVALRVHDPAAPTLKSFTGIPSFEPNERWVTTGSFTSFGESRTLTTGAVVEGLQHHHTALGTISFELDGTEQTLVAFAGKAGGFHILFTDGTSGVTTYAACRSLAVDDPDSAGRVTLDFNRASNLPCAFTDFATCPVAPPENRLSIAVEAGEKNPRP